MPKKTSVLSINLLSNTDLLTMSIDDVLAYKIMLRKEVLAIHKYSITPPKEGGEQRWSTYLPAPNTERGSRGIKAPTKEALIDKLVAFYTEQEESAKNKRKRFPQNITVAEFYPHWIEYKKKNPKLSTDTIKKYKTAYTKSIEHSEFGKMKVCEIDEVDIEEFLVTEIERRGFKKQAVKNFAGYLNQMFEYARRSRIIKENPYELVDCANNVYPYCVDIPKTKEEQTMTDKEMDTLRECLHQHQADHPLYMPDYAIEICTWTGLRVGEVAVLKWDIIKNGELHITQSEHRIVHDDKADTYEVGLTKNKKERKVPIGKELKELLNRIKHLQEENGISSEYIIADINGRVIAPTISKAMYRRGYECGLKAKSIHAIRRTVASRLYTIYSKPTVALIMGHTERVLDEHYAYDTVSLEDKQNAMDRLYSKVA